MTKIITIANNASNKFFNEIKATAESLANCFETRIHCMPGGNKEFKATDTCLSFKGEQRVYLYRIDECGTEYKLDPNTNCIQLIVNCDD